MKLSYFFRHSRAGGKPEALPVTGSPPTRGWRSKDTQFISWVSDRFGILLVVTWHHSM